MRSEAPPLLPILRSRTQGEVLAAVLLHPERATTLAQLSRDLGIAMSTAQLEVNRLLDAGLLTAEQVGRAKHLRVNPDNRLVPALTMLVMQAFGPLTVIAEEFKDLDAAAVVIFGSWAARYAGEVGPPPGDVDVLVLGDRTARGAMYNAAERAEARLGYPVNPTLRATERWTAGDDPLVTQIRASAHEVVSGQLPEEDSPA